MLIIFADHGEAWDENTFGHYNSLSLEDSARGILVGPADMFADLAYDETRRKAQEIAEYMRRHGPFEPHRLPLQEMEYTTLPGVLNKLKNRFVPTE